MGMTVTEYIAEVRAEMDAENSNRWSDARIEQRLSRTFQREWRKILNANPRYRVVKVTPTTDATTGRLAWPTDFETGTGDTKKHPYRILNINADNRIYHKVDLLDKPLAEDTGEQEYCWYQEGSNVMLLPKVTSTQVNVWVNWLPTAPVDLSANSVEPDWPETYEEILSLETAANLLAKGGAEFDTSQKLKAIAEELRAEMLQDLVRLGGEAETMRYPDTAEDWGV